MIIFIYQYRNGDSSHVERTPEGSPIPVLQEEIIGRFDYDCLWVEIMGKYGRAI